MGDERQAAGQSGFTAEHLGRAIAAAAAEAVVASDRAGLIQFWNPGYHAVMASGNSRYAAGDLLAVPALRKDGTTISVEFTITPLTSAAGEITGLVAVMRDVTATFAETKALRQKLRAVGER
jgi:PAS domain-containing protein